MDARGYMDKTGAFWVFQYPGGFTGVVNATSDFYNGVVRGADAIEAQQRIDAVVAKNPRDTASLRAKLLVSSKGTIAGVPLWRMADSGGARWHVSKLYPAQTTLGVSGYYAMPFDYGTSVPVAVGPVVKESQLLELANEYVYEHRPVKLLGAGARGSGAWQPTSSRGVTETVSPYLPAFVMAAVGFVLGGTLWGVRGGLITAGFAGTLGYATMRWADVQPKSLEA